MTTTRKDRQGNVFTHTTIEIPRYLREFARQNRISMSGLLRKCLEEKMLEFRGNGE